MLLASSGRPGEMRHRERVADMLREEIAVIVAYELDDPRIASASVTEVKLSENLRDASVYILVEGTDEDAGSALGALRHAAPYIRRQLISSLNIRHAPDLHFVRDIVEERALKVDRILEELEIKDKAEER